LPHKTEEELGESTWRQHHEQTVAFPPHMKTSKLELLAGLFVAIGIAAITWLTVKLGAGALIGGDTYVIEARFTNAGGLSSGGNVVVAGVPVGRVDGIRVDPVDFSAIVTLRVLSHLKLPTDSIASIKTTGLIGDKFIAIAPGADETNLKPGDRIVDTEASVDLESLIGKMAFGSVDKGAEDAAQEAPAPPP
jgi:phospholipid/cholesterol/gamma-HCH transport system substrate-binding protein